MLVILVLIAINVLLYWSTIYDGLIIDDTRSVKTNVDRKLFNNWDIRNIPTRLYGAGFFENPKLDKGLTIFLHTLASVLIYLAFGSNITSFVGAILYSVHPCNNQTAIWLNGRRYLINVILLLLMLICGKFGFIFYGLSALFQATVLPAPILYLFTSHWYYAVGVLILPLLWNKRIIGKMKKRNSSIISKTEYLKVRPRKLIIMVKTFGAYLFHLIVPVEVCFYPSFMQNYGALRKGNLDAYEINWDFWKGMVGIMGLSLLAFFIPQTRYFILWFTIFILPWCNFITIVQHYSDRYSSVAIIGICMLIAQLFIFKPLIVAMLIGYYIAKTIEIKKMYVTINDFYLFHLYKYPSHVMNLLFYSKQCLRSNMLFHAFVATRTGLIYNPNDVRLNIMHAKVLKRLGFNSESAEYVVKSEELLDDAIFMSREALIKDLMEI